MDAASLYYLSVSFALWVIFVLIVLRTYNPKRKESEERAKYRMLQDDD